MKTVLRSKFIALNVYIKEERYCISNSTAHLRAQEQKEEIACKRSRWQGYRAEINKIEMNKHTKMKRINEMSYFFEKNQ